MQLVTATSVPMVLLSTFRLGLFEIINKAGPAGVQLSAVQIASQLDSTNPDAATMLDRMLYLLATHSVLTCSAVEAEESGVMTRLYGLAPAGKFLVPNQELGGASLGPLLALIQDKVSDDCWYGLEDAFVNWGVAFERVHGIHLFGYAGKHPKYNDDFNQTMVSLTTISISRILDSYKGFEHLKSLVDVGGSLGL